jgi:hypothetical protein
LENGRQKGQAANRGTGSILQKVNKRIDQLKGPSTAMKIPALEKALSEKQEADKGLVEEIKLLKHEVSMHPKATAKKAG